MAPLPDYISIVDAAGNLKAVLSPEADGLTDCRIDAQLNGPCQLSFRLPATSEKAAELLPERRIRAGGREFLLLAPATEELTREGRKVWVQVTAPEAWIGLSKVYPTVANDAEPDPAWGTVSILASDLGQGGHPAGSAGSALHRLLAGSGWTVGTVDVAGTHDLETERLSLLANIHQVQEIWGGYLVWDSVNKTLGLRDEAAWQPGTGVRIQYAKNLKGVERTLDSDLVTRLYPFGQDGLTVASVNGGQLYIDDTHYTGTVLEGIYENQGIDDPAELLAAAQKALAELSEPRASYRVNWVDLSALPEYAHETVALGDLVRIIDPELSVDALARVERHSYDVFQPWKATVEIGKPAERLESMIAGTLNAAEFVTRALRPNPGTANLLKGFISAFATTIKSANGRLVWSDSTLQAIEIDGNGNPTGRRVQITPGGIGISTDGGQTFTTAITGQGILANTVIVSDLYALASDDGYTQLKGDGLHVFDAAQQERVHVGRWLIDDLEHYGIRIFSASGTVLLDDSGILQTWQEGRADNVDIGFPMTLSVYLPAETKSIKLVRLRFRRLAFRAYETGAAAGGGQTVGISANTTGASSSTTTGPSSTTTTGPSSVTKTSTAPSQANTAGASVVVLDAGGHRHADSGDAGFHYTDVGGEHGHATVDHWHAMPHTHDVNIDHTHNHDHTHSMAHTHDMSHSHTIPSHTHPIVYGIYTGSSPSDVTIKINGVDRTAALGGPFNTDQSNLDVAQYLTIGVWNTIEIGAASLGRVDATAFLQVFMGV